MHVRDWKVGLAFSDIVFDGVGPQFEMGKYPAGWSEVSASRGRGQQFQADRAPHVAANGQYAFAIRLHLDDDVAMHAGADSEMTAPLGDGRVAVPPAAAQQIARLDGGLADIVRGERSL